jgi:hypothetical protein
MIVLTCRWPRLKNCQVAYEFHLLLQIKDIQYIFICKAQQNINMGIHWWVLVY